MLAHFIPFPDAWRWASVGRDVHGLRPRRRLRVQDLQGTLRRLGRGARGLVLRCTRPLTPETLVWMVIAVLVLLFAITVFTRERAIAP
jgi:hypothetical protein